MQLKGLDVRRGDVKRLCAVFIETFNYLEGVDKVINMFLEASSTVLMSTTSEFNHFLLIAFFIADLALLFLFLAALNGRRDIMLDFFCLYFLDQYFNLS